MKLLILLSLIGYAFGQNTHGHTLDQILDMVVADTDINNDGVISIDEFQNELLLQFDLDGDQVVTRNEFINLWMAKYGDTHADTGKFFDNMDSIRDHKLTEFDLLFQMGQLDPDGDGNVTVAEFRAFMHAKHPWGHGR